MSAFPLPNDLPRPKDDGAADHLVGMSVPSIALTATTGDKVDLATLPRRVVVYAYPKTGVPGVPLPDGWNDIAGARGCTPQTLGFVSEHAVIETLGASVFGFSTQDPAYQKEMSDRLDLPFPILSDANLAFTSALTLPTMVVAGERLVKRITLVLLNGKIEFVFYPVFPPDTSASEVVKWLRANPSDSSANHSGVVIYTMPGCHHCKAAKTRLSTKGTKFTEIDSEQEPSAVKAMFARTGTWTLPQIFAGTKHLGGANDLQVLDKAGKLDSLLAHA